MNIIRERGKYHESLKEKNDFFRLKKIWTDLGRKGKILKNGQDMMLGVLEDSVQAKGITGSVY